jgi:hypothetical protein
MRVFLVCLLMLSYGCGYPVHEFRYAKAFDEAKTVAVVFTPKGKPERRVTPSQDWIDRLETQVRKDNQWRGEKFRKRELTNTDYSWRGTRARVELRGTEDLDVLYSAATGGTLQFLKPGEKELDLGLGVQNIGPYSALFKEIEKEKGY